MNKFKIVNSTDSADLYIYDVIGDWFDEVSAKQFKAEIDEIEGKLLNLHISSPGGSVFEGNTIANLIKSRKGTTVCFIEGLCASIATQIALSCDEVKMYKNSLFMIHRAMCGCVGNAKDFNKQANGLMIIDNVLAQTYVDKTGLDMETILNYMDEETWFDSMQCKELGFIDEIIEESQMVAKFDLDSVENFKHIPKELIDMTSSNNKNLKFENEKEQLLLELDLI